MSEGRKISSWERNLPLDAYLKRATAITYVVQCTLSPGCKEHPTWTSVYWYYLPEEVKARFKYKLVEGSEVAVFDDVFIAVACAKALNSEGSYRARVIARSTSIHEVVIP